MNDVNGNSKRSSILEKFRNRVKDCQLPETSDEYLTKWLVARNYDLEKAEAMLRRSMEWRRLHRVDSVLQTYERPEVFKQYYPMGMCGVDKFGSPVWISHHGNLDIRGFLHCMTKKEFMRSMWWVMENFSRMIQQENTRTGKKITNQTFIIDMENLPMKNVAYKPAMEVLVEVLQTLEGNYPEIVRRMFFINGYKAFNFVYNMFMKPFMHKGTVDKIRIFDCNKDEWSRALLEEIDANQLPVHYGGSLTDRNGDPKCPNLFNMGGEIPREYYFSNTPPQPQDDMEAMTVMSGSKSKLKFHVDIINSSLSWKFMSVSSGNIAYRIYRKTEFGAEDLLVPLEKVDCHLFMEEGELICEKTGKYIFEFDNSYSYLRSKKLHYKIHLTNPSKNVDPIIH